MTRNTHDLVNDHFGALSDAQIATGTATTGDAPLSNGDGTRTWGTISAGGLADLLTGNDANFTTTIGSWVSSSGSVTRDTGYVIAGTPASLKWAAPSGSQYVEVPISGTFTAGKPYAALVFLSVEETDSTYRTINVKLGVPGTDSNYNPVTIVSSTSRPGVGSGNFLAAQVFWTPTANRTSVKLRIETADATTLHVGLARAWQTPTIGSFAAGTQTPVYPLDLGELFINPWGNNYGVKVSTYGFAAIINSNNSGGFTTGGPVDGYSYCWVEHTPGDLTFKGYEFDVGDDYLAMFLSEKNSTTAQLYGYTDQDFELVEQGTGHWITRAADGGLAKPGLGMLPQYSSAPSSPVEGQSYYDTTLHKSRTWDGSAWQNWW